MPAKILVAEDNPINQKVVTIPLSKAGFDVDVVANGKEAVQACLEQRYDLILMDCQMPVLNGLDATRLIRELDIRQPIIIAVTANGGPNNRNDCIQSGMNDYVSKPFHSSSLIEMVRLALEQRAHDSE